MARKKVQILTLDRISVYILFHGSSETTKWFEEFYWLYKKVQIMILDRISVHYFTEVRRQLKSTRFPIGYKKVQIMTLDRISVHSFTAGQRLLNRTRFLIG